MKTNIYSILLSLFTVISGLHFYCTQTTCGGTGTETINTYAVYFDGTPAAGARIQVIDAQCWADSVQHGRSPVLSVGITNTNGYCSLAIPKQKGSLNIQIDAEQEGALHTISEEERGDVGTVVLNPYAAISGTVKTVSTQSDKFYLAGTAYHETACTSGHFSFSKIPSGPITLVSMQGLLSSYKFYSYVSLYATAGKLYTLPKNASDSKDQVLIDNFENGIGPTSIGAILPILNWYVLSDSLYYYWDCKSLQWLEGKTNPIGCSIISYDSSIVDDNHLFSFSTKLDEKSPAANAIVGISLKPFKATGIDLSNMTAISLRAAGHGTLRVRFETWGLEMSGYQFSHYTYLLSLTDTMQSYSIPVDSLSIVGYYVSESIFQWSNESKNVTRLEFSFNPAENNRGEALTLKLDDLYLQGISLSDIMEQREQ